MSSETRIHTLDNGVRLATTAMPHMASVSLGFWTGAGSRHEEELEHGMAHLVEHMLFKGTPTRSAQEISRQIEGLGASLDGFTVEDHTAYHTKGPSHQFESLCSVLADFYLNPTMDPSEIESEKQVIREEIAMVRDQPSQHLDDLISEAAWGSEHPLGRSITGTEASLEAFQRSDIQSFYQRAYCGKNTVISVAGNLNHDQVADHVSGLLKELPAGEVITSKAAPAHLPRHRFQEEEDHEQAHLALSFPGLDRFHEDRFALKLLDVILGENMSSRLFQELREQRGLCYEVQSDFVAFSDAGLLQIYLALNPDNVSEALTGISMVVDDLRLYGVTARELREAKAYLIGQSQISLENTSAQMMWAGETLMMFDQWIAPEEAHEKLNAVTADEVLAIARKTLDPRRLSSALIGTRQSRDTLENWLGAVV